MRRENIGCKKITGQSERDGGMIKFSEYRNDNGGILMMIMKEKEQNEKKKVEKDKKKKEETKKKKEGILSTMINSMTISETNLFQVDYGDDT